MNIKFLIIPAILFCQSTGAQNGAASFTLADSGASSPASGSASATMPPVSPSNPTPDNSGQTTYLDYKSVYETATVEDEVKMAAERFSLTASQQDMWLVAARDRRAAEKQAYDKLGSKANNYSKDGVYLGLRTAQNTFHETIIGYLTPAQKQALETDRLILQEKQKRMAKLPPPPPPVVKDTVPQVDSTAIKEAEMEKAKGKKSKKKKKSNG